MQPTPAVAVSPSDVETLISPWVVGKVLAGPALTGMDSLSAVSIYFDPGQGHDRHRHEASDQLIYMLSGEAEMTIEFNEGEPQTRLIRGGEMVSIPRGAYHSTFNQGWEPVRILAVYSPAGPESHMRQSAEFRCLPPDQVPARRGKV